MGVEADSKLLFGVAVLIAFEIALFLACGSLWAPLFLGLIFALLYPGEEGRRVRLFLGVSLGVSLGMTFFWVCAPVWAPFILGGVWAYLYRPILQRSSAWSIPNSFMAFFLTLLTYGFLFFLVILLFPLAKKLSSSLSFHFLHSREIFWESAKPILQRFFKDAVPKIQENIDTLVIEGIRWTTMALVYLLQNGWLLAQLFFSIFLSPMIGFYLMKDWDAIWDRFIALVPLSHRPLILLWAKEMNDSLAHYFRGQLTICGILSLYYGIGLELSSLRGGILFGFLTGIFLVLPYIGFGIGLVSVCIASIVQWGTTTHLLWVLCLYFGGYLLESLFLTPFLIGNRTGLHPIWVLFAIFAGGLLKGIVGVLIALPVATLLGAFWRLLRRFYLQSDFYRKGSCS